MKVLPGVVDPQAAKKIAKLLGLNSIKTSTEYTLVKTGAKTRSIFEYPDEMQCGRGNVYLAGYEDYVWIVLVNERRWFKTSPVLKCEKTDTGYRLETANSFYELKK